MHALYQLANIWVNPDQIYALHTASKFSTDDKGVKTEEQTLEVESACGAWAIKYDTQNEVLERMAQYKAELEAFYRKNAYRRSPFLFFPNATCLLNVGHPYAIHISGRKLTLHYTNNAGLRTLCWDFDGVQDCSSYVEKLGHDLEVLKRPLEPVVSEPQNLRF
jgi:hypothetical protein